MFLGLGQENLPVEETGQVYTTRLGGRERARHIGTRSRRCVGAHECRVMDVQMLANAGRLDAGIRRYLKLVTSRILRGGGGRGWTLQRKVGRDARRERRIAAGVVRVAAALMIVLMATSWQALA